MTHEAIANVIRSRFGSQIQDVYGLTTQYDNQGLDKPDKKMWCRLIVNFGNSPQVSLGDVNNRRFRTVGVMSAQLFMPTEQGDGELLKMADNILIVFRGINVNNVHFGAPHVDNLHRTEDNYWQVNVTCPFYADDIG